MEEEWKIKFVKWFEDEIADSNKPLDEHWDVEVKEENENIWIKAENPKNPFSIFVNLYRGFASLQIYTGLETKFLDSEERLRIYGTLLILNRKWKMVKYVLAGTKDEIIIVTDLDLSSLSKEEFSHALTVTLFAFYDMINELGLEEGYEMLQLGHIYEIITRKSEEGKTKEEIAEYIEKTLGIEHEVAKEMVNAVLKGDSSDKNLKGYV